MNPVFILLDIDGVMVHGSGWQPAEVMPDGFYRFAPDAEKSLEWLLQQTGATIILISTLRSSYSDEQWKVIFDKRIAHVSDVRSVDDSYSGKVKGFVSRLQSVLNWVKDSPADCRYVIIDDDKSLVNLPSDVKKNWVQTFPFIGLNKETAAKALEILTTPDQGSRN